MAIYCQMDGSKYQLWALFDWYPLTGVFRFMEPVIDDLQNEHGDRKQSTPEPPSSFSLSSLPSPSAPVTPFRWRGEKEESGRIQLGDDCYPCTMTFSAEGAKCNGIFASDMAGTVRFSGFKIDRTVPKPKKGPQKEWKARSEEAYNRAWAKRYRRWYGPEESSNDDEEDVERKREERYEPMTRRRMIG